jgi:hypothetical protein
MSLTDEIYDVHASIDGEPKKIIIPSTRFRAPLRLQPDAEGNVSFYRPSAADSEQQWVRVAEAVLPDSVHTPLLLFYPSSDQPETYNIHVMEFSRQTVSPGSFLLMNLTGKSVNGRIGGRQFTLNYREPKTIKPAVNARTLEVILLYAEATEREALLTTTWFYNEAHRYLVFLFPDKENRDRIGIRTIRKFEDPEPVAESP